MEPDASPCDVAEICRKPCVEVSSGFSPFLVSVFKRNYKKVYVERLNFFKDEDIQDANNDAENIRFKDIEIRQ